MGAVADNFDERIEQKLFHAEIVIDREKLAGETASYVPIPEISSFRDADGVDRMEEIIRRNYTQIKEDVSQIIKRELRRIAEDPRYGICWQRSRRIDKSAYFPCLSRPAVPC